MTISGEALTVLGDIDNGRARIEQQGQWLNVKTSAGYSGYVAAWLVSMTQPSPTPPAQTLTVYATDVLNLRASIDDECARTDEHHCGPSLDRE